MLVGAVSPVNQTDFISAEGDFHKEIYIAERTRNFRKKDRKNRVRKRRVVGRIYGMKYS